MGRRGGEEEGGSSPDASGSEDAGPVVEPEAEADNWVQCDRCRKWRRVPAALADALGEDEAW